MFKYLIKRLLFVIPTLWAIITLNFFIVQIAPGGPVEQAIANLEFNQLGDSGTANLNQSNEPFSKHQTEQSNAYRGARGLDPEIIDEINKRFGFDKPLHQRYFEMLWRYIKFDFGDSFFKGSTVLELIKERLPVSISLGLWSTLLIYLISIPLGIKKAVSHGSRFDLVSSWIVIVLYSIPGFLFAMLLIVIFAGGSYLDWFPLRGLSSINNENFTWFERVVDYIRHITLPVIAMTIGGFATLTFLTKNSFIAEINKQYVVTARAKGLSEGAILYQHIFRNAMLIIIAGFPAAFISMFFTSSVLIEVIFSLNGIGLLGYEATLQRDYPVMFGTLYIFTLLGLVLNIISDLTYSLVDPRIDFESR